MTGALTLSKTQAKATSTWSGTTRGGVTFYTTPTWDYDSLTITVPAAIAAGKVSGVKLTYTGALASGSKSIKFADTRDTFSNSALLTRIQNGETSIPLLFSFKASGGSGGAGDHSSTCYWQNLACNCDYTPAAAVSGTASVGASSIYYGIKKTSAALGESIKFTAFVLTASASTTACSISIREHGKSAYISQTFSCKGSSGQQSNRTPSFSFTGLAMENRVSNADIKFTVTLENGTVQQSSWISTGLKLVRERLAPSVSVVWSDTTDAYTKVGEYVQGQTVLSAAITAALDTEAVSDIAAASYELTIGDQTYTGGSTILVETGSLSGQVAYEIKVADTEGMTGTKAGTLSVAAYTAPVITQLAIERYAEKTSSTGETYYELSDDGAQVWVTLKANVAAVNGRNAWNITAKYGNITTTLVSGSEGAQIERERDRDIFTATLSANESWGITVTISDMFENAAYAVLVPKAGAIFSIEAGGVGIGKRNNASEDSPELQVAYPAHFESGIFDANGHEIGSDDYTTSTVAIGKFLGKTLYRKVKSFSTYSTDSANPTTLNMNISPTAIVRLDGYVKTTSYGMLPINCYHSASIRSFCRPNGLTGNFIGYAGCANSGAVLIIEYLKD